MTEPSFPTIVTTRRVVPNVQPFAEPTPYRIAIIGEAPGEDEENHGFPFVGRSGQHLDRELKSVGIDRHRCFIGNICQVRPPKNKIELFPWDGEEIQNGLKQLEHDLSTFSPNLCLLLGNTPLHAALGKGKITEWRGSLFRSEVRGAFFGRKCVSSLHPAFVLREFEGNPLFRFDLSRARAEGETPELNLPQRELITTWSASEICYVLDTWPVGVRCSVDIEGGLPSDCVNEAVKKDSKKRRYVGWRCVALSAQPTKAFAIAWWKFNEFDHKRLLQSYARLMARLDVPKVLQNSLYDNFVMSYGWGIPIRNVVEDTMLKNWEIYCELPKKLSVQASIWTREPHWKNEDMYETTGENLALGCCKDVAVTLEICNGQDHHLKGGELAHYRKNMELLNPALYMELRGIRYDLASVAKRQHEVKVSGWTDENGKFYEPISKVGELGCQLAGREIRGPSGCVADKRLAKIMYEEMQFEPQYKLENGGKKLTTDIDALLKLRKKHSSLPGPKLDFLNAIIRHRHLEGLLETLNIKADPDGRVRCAYNVVGTDTGRFSCKTSPTGAGANLTTITKKLRYNYVADPGYDFFQCDLAGADGWTVGAHAARLGDPTMLDDYYFGLKPAKIIAFMYGYGPAEVAKLEREDLLFWSQKTQFNAFQKEFGEWLYDGCKVVQHGGCYMMGIPTMQANLMKRSFKDTGIPTYMEHRDGAILQSGMFARYWGVKLWHQWAESKLVADGTLTSASGHTRVFFGRRFGKDIHDTVKQFLADEPQQNTTWATNLAMLKLWNDPDNRRPDGSLIIEPLHQVHDAICGQWPQGCRDWARAKVRSYFQNPLTIASTTLTIPFDGAYGPSWGNLPHPL